MWDDQNLYIAICAGVSAALLTYKLWGDFVYTLTRNWRLVGFVVSLSLIGWLGVMQQQNFKHNLVFSYFANMEYAKGQQEARYQIRQCKEFVQAKMHGADTAEYRTVSAGPINLTKINNWDFCAKTFGMNFWKYDTSIDGQDGGRLLCEAYARDNYRSSKVQSWCDTVFSPTAMPKNQKV
ncbi:MAG: hypothetical protein H6867_06575 [Rhodospirillales bacterium]|nr:hypothetical protein [Rhodospirillales bacterium]MCB9995213.1 hypothetical protein [Rhodospirillales bacterium]